ncbi:hypothetical protein DF185_09335 [Marinifilum breve]|uniref:Uncharacterized protein n=2 Tax=Marinifilum breve TaxID=2184082 RepID=A0A2V4A2U6_9BACT|nr:hypothetical protein DF185_09335 [Marinifilum breve]
MVFFALYTSSLCAQMLSVNSEKPQINMFYALPLKNNSSVVQLKVFATDNKGVMGFLLKDENTTTNITEKGWSKNRPVSYQLKEYGIYNLYLWVKDTDGNITGPASCKVNYDPKDSIKPVIEKFECRWSANNEITFDIKCKDNIGVDKYLIKYNCSDGNTWTSQKPSKMYLKNKQEYTFYLWVKDIAGNLSTVCKCKCKCTNK